MYNLVVIFLLLLVFVIVLKRRVSGLTSGGGSCLPCRNPTTSEYYTSSSGCEIKNCPAGSFTTSTNNVGANACVKCAPGTYASASGSCLPCPEGKYSSTAGATSCTNCPPGNWTPAGSTSCNYPAWSKNGTYKCPQKCKQIQNTVNRCNQQNVCDYYTRSWYDYSTGDEPVLMYEDVPYNCRNESVCSYEWDGTYVTECEDMINPASHMAYTSAEAYCRDALDPWNYQQYFNALFSA